MTGFTGKAVTVEMVTTKVGQLEVPMTIVGVDLDGIQGADLTLKVTGDYGVKAGDVIRLEAGQVYVNDHPVTASLDPASGYVHPEAAPVSRRRLTGEVSSDG